MIYTKDEKVVDRALRSAYFEDLNEKKTVLRKVFSIRKVNNYSLLREKVL